MAPRNDHGEFLEFAESFQDHPIFTGVGPVSDRLELGNVQLYSNELNDFGLDILAYNDEGLPVIGTVCNRRSPNCFRRRNSKILFFRR